MDVVESYGKLRMAGQGKAAGGGGGGPMFTVVGIKKFHFLDLLSQPLTMDNIGQWLLETSTSISSYHSIMINLLDAWFIKT